MLVSGLSSFGIVVQNHVIGVSLGFPGFRHWLHKTLLGYVHQLPIDGRVRIHAQKLRIVLYLLLLGMIALLLLIHEPGDHHFLTLAGFTAYCRHFFLRIVIFCNTEPILMIDLACGVLVCFVVLLQLLVHLHNILGKHIVVVAL